MTEGRGGSAVFCETEAQTEALLARRRRDFDDWVALTPPAALALSRHGVKYSKLEDFFDPRDFLDEGEARLHRQAAWMRWTDDWLMANSPVLAELEFKAASAFFFRIKNFVDRLLVHRQALSVYVAARRPQTISWQDVRSLCFRPPPTDNHGFEVDYMALALPLVARSEGIELRRLGVAMADLRVGAASVAVRAARFARARARSSLALIPHQSHAGLPTTTEYLLVLRGGHDIGPLLPELVDRGLLIVSADDLVNRPPFASVAVSRTFWERLLAEPSFWAISDGWIEGRETIRSWLEEHWCSDLDEAAGVALASRQALRDSSSCRGVLVANCNSLRTREIGVLQAARSAGIPVITYIHGSLPGYCRQPVQVFWDMLHSDLHFVYAPAVADYLRGASAAFGVASGAVRGLGSARLDAITARARVTDGQRLRNRLVGEDRRPAVLYVCSALQRHQRFTGDCYSAVPYFELQKRAIEALAEFPDIRVLYKGFTGDWGQLVPAMLRAQIPDAVVVTHRQGRLTDVMWCADAIIVDLPSTALGEVLMTSKRLLVYSDARFVRMLPEARALLSRRAIVAEDPDGFAAGIRELVRFGADEGPDPEDTEFRRHYMTGEDDGRSATRVADAIVAECALPVVVPAVGRDEPVRH